MEWYYSDGRRQLGPVSEDELRSLASQGLVGVQTLVWRTGLQNWTPYGVIVPPSPSAVAVQAPPGTQFCTQCGTPHPPEDLLTIGGATVCAGCKDTYLHQLREGTLSRPLGVGAIGYAGFWIRVVA